MEVLVCDQIISFENITKDGYVIATYNVVADSHFDIKVIFASSASLNKQTGYVTSGMDLFDIFEVTNNEIIHKNQEVLSPN